MSCIFKVRKQVIKFIKEDIIPNMQEYGRQRDEILSHPKYANDPEMGHLRAPQPALLKDLREKAKKAGLYNFFLPEVRRQELAKGEGERGRERERAKRVPSPFGFAY